MLLTLRSQYGGASPRAAADAVISALSPAAWYRNATDVVESGGFASIWADYASSDVGLVLPGVNGNYASAPDAAPLDITDDFEIIVRCVANDYTPAADNTLVGKWGSGTEAYRFFITGTTGILNFTMQGIAAYVSTVAPTCTDGTAYWFRVTRVRSTGKINFYQADDSATVPSSWTQVGTEVSGGTFACNSTTAVLSIGASGTTSTLSGTIYRAIIRSTIGGSAVFDADFSAQAIGAGSFTESSSNAATVTINASGAAPAHIGKARDLLQGTGTNQPAYNSTGGVFTFDGADNFMIVNFTMNQPFTVALRVTPVSWTDGDRFFDGATNGNNYVYQTTATPRILQRGSAVGATSAAGTPSLSAKHSLIFVFNGASGVMNIDGTEQASNAGTNNATGWTLACNGARIGTEASSIVVYEAVLFTSALDATQRSNLKTALDLI